MFLNESGSLEFWKVSSVVAIFKNIWEASVSKNYRPVSLLFMVNKFFEKLKNKMLVGHLEKFGFFLISSMVLILLKQKRACLWEASEIMLYLEARPLERSATSNLKGTVMQIERALINDRLAVPKVS